MKNKQFFYRQGLMLDFYANLVRYGTIINDFEKGNKRTRIINYNDTEYIVILRAGYISTLSIYNPLPATVKKNYWLTKTRLSTLYGSFAIDSCSQSQH